MTTRVLEVFSRRSRLFENTYDKFLQLLHPKRALRTGSGLEVAKTRFHTFLRGKGVLFTWKCQIREFHAHGMEREEVLER